MHKQALFEHICTKYTIPAVVARGWVSKLLDDAVVRELVARR